jgi:ParB family chromosome partitioning protein
MDVKEIPLDKLVPSRNLRTEGVDVAELVESIREHGLLQPIRVRPIASGLYQIIAGHRRFQAHRALGRPTITSVVVAESDKAAAEQGIVENLQREDLTPLELAHGIRELAAGFGLTPEEIARAISKSPSQVKTWIRISRLPDDVLTKLESGEGRTQLVTGLTPRLIQPFITDMPAEEEAARDPAAAARFQETVTRVVRFQEEIEERGERVNAHMADEIARRTRSGQMTLEEAIDEVLAHPDKYRYARPVMSGDELEQDTWAAYRQMHQDMSGLAYRLRPEIALLFSPPQKRDLLERLEGLLAMLENYRAALETENSPTQAAPLQLGEGDQSPDAT